MVSDIEIYNIKNGAIKRKIKIDKLGGISISMVGSENEFTLHVPSEYDARFTTADRYIIIKIL